MSQSGKPLLHEVIQMMDLLEAMLKEKAEDPALPPIVRAGASLGCEILNKYYSKTDESIMYRGAVGKSDAYLETLVLTAYTIVMDPSLKKSYFEREGWPDSWIQAALTIVRDEWKRYKPHRATSPPTTVDEVRLSSLAVHVVTRH